MPLKVPLKFPGDVQWQGPPQARVEHLADWKKELTSEGRNRRAAFGEDKDGDVEQLAKGGLQIFEGPVNGSNLKLTMPFSRNPTAYSVSLDANIATAIVPGARNVSLQHLGSKGRTYTLDVLFHNAFLSKAAWPAHKALEFLTAIIEGDPGWRVVWYPGSIEGPLYQIALMSVTAEASLFVPGKFVGRREPYPAPSFMGEIPPPNEPQRVMAKLKFRLEDAMGELVDPFKLRRPPRRRRRGATAMTPQQRRTEEMLRDLHSTGPGTGTGGDWSRTGVPLIDSALALVGIPRTGYPGAYVADRIDAELAMVRYNAAHERATNAQANADGGATGFDVGFANEWLGSPPRADEPPGLWRAAAVMDAQVTSVEQELDRALKEVEHAGSDMWRKTLVDGLEDSERWEDLYGARRTGEEDSAAWSMTTYPGRQYPVAKASNAVRKARRRDVSDVTTQRRSPAVVAIHDGEQETRYEESP